MGHAGRHPPRTRGQPMEVLKITKTSPTAEVVAWCKEQNIPAELVGRWVWVSFSEKPSPDTRAALVGAGFRWIKRRLAWAHCCGVKSRRSPANPKDTYGAIPVSELELA